MTWLRSLGTLEYILISCFLVLYVMYIIRIILIARKMKSRFKRVFYKFFIRSFYFALLLAGLLGPSFGNAKKEIKSISKEIYIVTDVSLSMNATDIQPSRIEKVKQELKKMVSAFNSDRVGLIIFGSSAFLQCPPTYDQSALNLFIETLNVNLVTEGGSDISQGLQLALDQQINSGKKNLNKVIILISDGEDFGKNTNDVVKEIKKNNIKFFTLGIGTESGSKIPFNGTYKKDKKGNPVLTNLDSKLLKDMAEEGEGKYFEINEKIDEGDFLIKSVSEIQGSISDTREMDASANKYFYFLLIALFFIIIDVLVTVRTVRI